MSACGSPLSSNRRMEPAVAVNANVRPGSSSVCLVVESGGRRCYSAADGVLGVWPPRALGLPFWSASVVASGRDGGLSAQALPITPQANRASAREARRSAVQSNCIESPPSRKHFRPGHTWSTRGVSPKKGQRLS